MRFGIQRRAPFCQCRVRSNRGEQIHQRSVNWFCYFNFARALERAFPPASTFELHRRRKFSSVSSSLRRAYIRRYNGGRKV